MIVWSIFAHELRWIAKVDFALGGLWSVVITPSIKLFVRLAFCVFLCPFAIGVCHEKNTSVNLLWYWNHIDEQNVRFTLNIAARSETQWENIGPHLVCFISSLSLKSVCWLICERLL